MLTCGWKSMGSRPRHSNCTIVLKRSLSSAFNPANIQYSTIRERQILLMAGKGSSTQQTETAIMTDWWSMWQIFCMCVCIHDEGQMQGNNIFKKNIKKKGSPLNNFFIQEKDCGYSPPPHHFHCKHVRKRSLNSQNEQKEVLQYEKSISMFTRHLKIV